MVVPDTLLKELLLVDTLSTKDTPRFPPEVAKVVSVLKLNAVPEITKGDEAVILAVVPPPPPVACAIYFKL